MLYANSKEIQQLNFARNLERNNGATIFFITKEARETILDFLQGTVKALWLYFTLT